MYPEKTCNQRRSQTHDRCYEIIVRMLQKFLASELTQPEGRIIGIEEKFRGVLIPGLPDLLGYVDLLLETDDAVIVRDFKTSRSAWDPQQATDQSDQLLLYADLVRKVMPGKQRRLQFAVLTKARDPKIQLLETPFDESKLDRMSIPGRKWRTIPVRTVAVEWLRSGIWEGSVRS